MKRNIFLKGLLSLSAIPLLSFRTKSTIKKNPVIEFTPEILNKHNFGLYIINDKEEY